MSECFCRCHTTYEGGDCEHCRLIVTPVTFKCPAYGPVAVGDIKKLQDNYSCSWPIGKYIGKVDAVDGDMIEVKLDTSIPTNIGEFVKLYGVSGHFTVPIPSEGQIKPLGGPTLESIPTWGVKSWDEPYPWSWYNEPEAKLRPYHIPDTAKIKVPRLIFRDEPAFFSRTSFKPVTQTATFTITGWKMMELSTVKKPFNSEGYIK